MVLGGSLEQWLQMLYGIRLPEFKSCLLEARTDLDPMTFLSFLLMVFRINSTGII